MSDIPLRNEPVTMPVSQTVFDPVSRTLFDPPADITRLREREPLCRLRYPDGHVGWLVTNHALARTVLGDNRFSIHPMRSPVGEPGRSTAALVDGLSKDPRFGRVFRRYAAEGRPLHEALDDPVLLEQIRSDPPSSLILVGFDPPKHTLLRRMLAGYFTARRVGAHREMVEAIVNERLDVMERHGPPLDLMEVFTLPIPSLVICALLGSPPADRERFERPSVVMQDPETSAEDKVAARREYDAFAHELIRSKRAHPADDLLSDLARRGELTDDELADVAVQLFTAGHETTANMLALATLTLLHDEDQWNALVADPTLIGSAVEELLRYVTLVQVGAFTRTATQDVDLAGERIRAGESVTVSLAAANRDPDRFDDPDLLALSRDATGHLAFGHGVHQCLGQHLARLEMQTGLTALSRRFPGLRLAVPVSEVPIHRGDAFIYGVHRLQVTW